MPEKRASATIAIEGVALHLAHPDELPIRWVGQPETMKQLAAAWSVVDPRDLPMNPRLLGKPGVGKTTLAYAAGKARGQDVYIFQATMDTRPEDLLITPVIDREGGIRYVASSLVTAMIRGGVAIIDEGNRMSEKSWASLAPLLDNRRYVESIVAGVKVRAHADFRFVATMNDDASTYELPIHPLAPPAADPARLSGSRRREGDPGGKLAVRRRRDPHVRDGLPPGGARSRRALHGARRDQHRALRAEAAQGRRARHAGCPASRCG